MNKQGTCLMLGSGLRRTAGAWVLLGTLALLWHPVTSGKGKSGPQRSFAAPEEAAKALGAAYRNGDRKAVAEILGDTAWRLVFSGDPVIDRHERGWFLSLYKEGHEVVAESNNRAVLSLGRDDVPYPIPIVKKGAQWRFDASEGHEDLLSRRMSKTELSALDVVVAYIQAQRAYHQEARRGDGVMQVMPATGKELAVGDIRQIEPNIHADVKYMRFMMDQFYEKEPMDRLNKGLFTFASYNAGPGRLQQLRKQAATRGLDPNVWFNNVELIAAEKVGRETVTYVSNIYKYYLAYKLITEEWVEREKAKESVKQGTGK